MKAIFVVAFLFLSVAQAEPLEEFFSGLSVNSNRVFTTWGNTQQGCVADLIEHMLLEGTSLEGYKVTWTEGTLSGFLGYQTTNNRISFDLWKGPVKLAGTIVITARYEKARLFTSLPQGVSRGSHDSFPVPPDQWKCVFIADPGNFTLNYSLGEK